MNEGAVATRAGLPGQPAEAEEVIVARDLILVEMTGARYHVAHASTARTIAMVRDAKSRGLPVTCEVTPHHLALTEDACAGYDTSTKMYPPLGRRRTRSARSGPRGRGIDAIATDHAPHSSTAKQLEFDCAAFGVIGLETALPIALSLVSRGVLPLARAIERLTWGPARAFRAPRRNHPRGAVADVTVIDPGLEWTVTADETASKSKNTPLPRPDDARSSHPHDPSPENSFIARGWRRDSVSSSASSTSTGRRFVGLLDRADALHEGRKSSEVLLGRTVVNLFMEPSTHTRTSFEIAAKRLDADVVNVSESFSSSKRARLLDTARTSTR